MYYLSPELHPDLRAHGGHQGEGDQEQVLLSEAFKTRSKNKDS
jgi:hypothetical protein